MDRLEATARAQDTHFWFRGFRRFLSDRLDHVTTGGRRVVRILDCGCGAGANLELLGRYGRVYAFDLSEIGLRHARRSGRRLVRADIARIPFPDATFDLVTSFDVFQMLPDDRLVLREMARVLRPGGTILISAAALEALRGDHSSVWEEARRYTPAMARSLVMSAGLEISDVSFLFASLVPLMYLVRAAQRRFPASASLRGRSDIEVPSALVNTMLSGLLAGEAMLARRIAMPFGSSLLVTARKP